jgi:DNA polymerase-1
MQKKRKEILLLIDSYALIHRAYHAFPPSLITREGKLVNAVYGFTRLLLEVIEKFDPTYAVAALDAPGKTVRHTDYGAYKANRAKTDNELVQQIPDIEEILYDFDIPMVKMPGYEADDLIGTLDKRFSNGDKQTIIVTGDRDLFQLVDEDTFVYLAGGSFSQSKLFGVEDVKEKMGVLPSQIVDYKAICGDASDNIPGVAGIGDKGAAKLLTEHQSLEGLYANIDKVENRYRDKLTANYEMAKLSQSLATIITEVPMDFDFKTATFGTFEAARLEQKFRALEFTSLTQKLAKLVDRYRNVNGAHGQLSMLAQPVENALVTKPWNTKALTLSATDTLCVTPKINMAGDPLTWQLEKLYFVRGAEPEVWEVGQNEIAQFTLAIKDALLVGVDLKPLAHAFRNIDADFSARYYDLALSTYLTSFGRSKQDEEGVLNYYQQALPTAQGEYAQIYCQIYEQQQADLKEKGLVALAQLENDLLPVVAQMERNGIFINKTKLDFAAKRLEEELDKLVKQIYYQVGHEFNVGSPKQVGEVLFGELGLPTMKKTKSGGYSTDERTLRELVHVNPVVEMILSYRELSKLISTYLKPLPALINPKTGKVHGTFHQIGAITGRFSSQNPNMQNIPVGHVAGVNVRESFEAPPGHVFVAFDYSQQELRLLAELSQEENMQKAFKEGKDIHAVAASDIFGIPLAEVDKDKRRIGKTINFGIVYGISAFGLADRLKIEQKTASEYIKKYFATYPRVREYYDKLIADAKQSGEVSTLLGRKRSAADLKASNFQLRAAVEREVMNFPLQGSAADIVKKAMVGAGQLLDAGEIKMVLQVHDELIFEYPWAKDPEQLAADPQFQTFVTEMKKIMLGTVKLQVPLEVGVEIGLNWGELKEIS